MPRDYEREYNDDTNDYKRKRRDDDNSGAGDDEVNNAGPDAHEINHTQSADMPPLNEKAGTYLQECLEEKKSLDKKFNVSRKLLDEEIEKILISGRVPKHEIYANVYSEKPIRVAQKVVFPIKEFPKFNFVGKLLGPKGNTLRQLQEETCCKMIIMGRNSMRDHGKEEELRTSGNLKFAHLNRDLHIEVSTVAPPAEAYHRIAYALSEVRKFMVPDANDDIRLEQMRELDTKDRMYKKPHMYPGSVPHKHYIDHHPGHMAYSSRSPTLPPSYDKTAKPKVYTILEKARYVMDDPNYGVVKSHRSREHEIYDHHGEYERYASPPPPTSKHANHHTPYESVSYERDYRRDYHAHSSSSYSTAYAAKPANGRSSTSYRPASSSATHSSTPYESGSRSRESVRYRSAPYPKIR